MQDRHTHRERERHKWIRYIPIATITKWQQPLLKVTKSLYIVTNLGQLPFMLFTQMAWTGAVQGTVWIRQFYTCIRHSPVMGIYMGYLKLQLYTGLSDRSVLFESAGFEERKLNWSGRKSWSRSSKSRCRLSETILRSVRLYPDRFVVTPI